MAVAEPLDRITTKIGVAVVVSRVTCDFITSLNDKDLSQFLPSDAGFAFTCKLSDLVCSGVQILSCCLAMLRWFPFSVCTPEF